MKVCVGLSICLLLQVLWSDVESTSDRNVGHATALIEQMEQAMRDAAKGTTPSREVSQLLAFMKSTNEVTRQGLTARVQLEYLTEKLNEWKTTFNGHVEVFWYLLRMTNQSPLLMSNQHHTADSDSGFNSSHGASSEIHIDVTCPSEIIDCPEWTKTYRTFDGSCNNLHPGRTQYGSAGRAQAHTLLPHYADGISSPRVAHDGSPLPSARAVSEKCLPIKPHPSAVNTLMMMTFGQFLDHDIVHTPVSTFIDENGTVTAPNCGGDECNSPGPAGADCFPITIPDGDRMKEAGRNCMTFIRSEPILEDFCVPSPRSQANMITSYVDASVIYGSSQHEVDDIRDQSDTARGKMDMSPNPINAEQKPFLPYMDNDKSKCSGVDETVHCFKSGDVRQNEQIGLTCLHTLMARLHNYVEEGLQGVNPDWSGDKLFNESRRIVGAVWQNMVYKEYLPAVLGEGIMDQYHLTLGAHNEYNNETDADITSEFSTAAFRFGHTQIPDQLPHSNQDMEHMEYSALPENFFNPVRMYQCTMMNDMSCIDSHVLGMCEQPSEDFSRDMSEAVRDKLFAEDPTGFGLDLAALNIQRGRDHGLPGYVYWREACNLQRATDYSDLQGMSEEAKQGFSEAYSRVEDIDLFAAGVSEHPLEGAFVGPTFACIIADQFKKLKEGDRFFYTHSEAGFTPEQRSVIGQYSISRWLCDTLDHVHIIQPYALYRPFSKLNSTEQAQYQSLYSKMNSNTRVPCDQIPGLNFDVFATNAISP